MMELDLHRVGLGPGHDMTPYIMTGSRTITHCRRPWFERLESSVPMPFVGASSPAPAASVSSPLALSGWPDRWR